jgi:hypothetical protein
MSSLSCGGGVKLSAGACALLLPFALFLLVQHNVLSEAVKTLGLQAPPTSQTGVVRGLRPGKSAGPPPQIASDGSAWVIGRAGAGGGGGEGGGWGGAGLGGGGVDGGRAGGVVGGGFLGGGFIPNDPRSVGVGGPPPSVRGGFVARAVAWSESAGSNNSDAGGREEAFASAPALDCFVEITLVADEGEDVGHRVEFSAEECAESCNQAPDCHSFSYRWVGGSLWVTPVVSPLVVAVVVAAALLCDYFFAGLAAQVAAGTPDTRTHI